MSFFSVAIALATDFYTLSLHDALPIFNQFAHIGREVVFRLRRRVGDYREHGEVNVWQVVREPMAPRAQDRKSTRLNSSHMSTSYAVFCLKKKTCAYFSFFAAGSVCCLA